jgi:hypothetical protein
MMRSRWSSGKERRRFSWIAWLPGLCRQSIEAACIEVVRRRRLQKGRPHEEIERPVCGAYETASASGVGALRRRGEGGDVYAGVKNRFGARQADTVRACNEGAH